MSIYQNDELKHEILACAARLVVEDGFEYGPAKRQAIQQLNLPSRTPLPDNDALENAVREHIAIFYAQTQPLELKLLREIALKWMILMQDFSPYLSGAVWHGTATKHSDIHLQLFCDDPKMAEIHLINHQIKYVTDEFEGINNKTIHSLCATEFIDDWEYQTLIHMSIYDLNDIRGALKADTKGRTPRGNLSAVQKLLTSEEP